MAETWFTPKEWKARLVEFAGRRLLRNVANGESTPYDVSRSEGQVSQEGDAFNTKNMNDLEQRITNGFAKAKTNIDALNRDLSAMNDNGAITGMDAREDGVYITYSTGADTVTKKLCDPDIKKHKITGKTFSVKASEISASKILGVGIEKFSYSVGVDNANWSYGCSISSSYSDDSASGSVSATWGGPAGAGNYNISATWIVYYLG